MCPAEPAARAPLENIKTSAPLELVCIDFWSAEDNNDKSMDVLVIIDHFTNLADALQDALQCQTAQREAKKLWDGFLLCLWLSLDKDQGMKFESELLAERSPVASKVNITGVERPSCSVGSSMSL